MGIKNLINKAGAKAADKLAKLSALSPEQLKAVEEQKEKYLADRAFLGRRACHLGQSALGRSRRHSSGGRDRCAGSHRNEVA